MSHVSWQLETQWLHAMVIGRLEWLYATWSERAYLCWCSVLQEDLQGICFAEWLGTLDSYYSISNTPFQGIFWHSLTLEVLRHFYMQCHDSEFISKVRGCMPGSSKILIKHELFTTQAFNEFPFHRCQQVHEQCKFGWTPCLNWLIHFVRQLFASPPPKTHILTPWQMFMCQSIGFHVDVEELQAFRR